MPCSSVGVRSFHEALVALLHWFNGTNLLRTPAPLPLHPFPYKDPE